MPGAFLLWIGLAALGTAGFTLLASAGLEGQVTAFVLWTAVLVGAVAWRVRRRFLPSSVNAPGTGVVGQLCRAAGFRDGEGRVRLGDGTWSARLAEGTDPAEGQALRVVGLDGTVLLVSDRV